MVGEDKLNILVLLRVKVKKFGSRWSVCFLFRDKLYSS